MDKKLTPKELQELLNDFNRKWLDHTINLDRNKEQHYIGHIISWLSSYNKKEESNEYYLYGETCLENGLYSDAHFVFRSHLLERYKFDPMISSECESTKIDKTLPRKLLNFMISTTFAGLADQQFYGMCFNNYIRRCAVLMKSVVHLSNQSHIIRCKAWMCEAIFYWLFTKPDEGDPKDLAEDCLQKFEDYIDDYDGDFEVMYHETMALYDKFKNYYETTTGETFTMPNTTEEIKSKTCTIGLNKFLASLNGDRCFSIQENEIVFEKERYARVDVLAFMAMFILRYTGCFDEVAYDRDEVPDPKAFPSKDDIIRAKKIFLDTKRSVTGRDIVEYITVDHLFHIDRKMYDEFERILMFCVAGNTLKDKLKFDVKQEFNVKGSKWYYGPKATIKYGNKAIYIINKDFTDLKVTREYNEIEKKNFLGHVFLTAVLSKSDAKVLNIRTMKEWAYEYNTSDDKIIEDALETLTT